MAIVDFAGEGVFIPTMPGILVSPTLATTPIISSANASDKLAQVGHVAFAARTGSKTLTKVHFLFGTVVKSNGSTLRVSLQDVDLANGPPIRPDGTADQSVTIANADAGWATGLWYTATLGASRTVNYGDLLAVVFDWASAVSGDSVIIPGCSLSSPTSNAGGATHQNCSLLFTASAWSVLSMNTNIILEFNDGTFGTLGGSIPASAVGTLTFNSSSTPDEQALEFQLPFDTEVDGAWVMISPSSGDFDIVLYSGTTALATVNVDPQATQAASARFLRVGFPKVALTADTTYRLAVKPNTTNSVSIYYRDVAAASHRAVTSLGTSARLNTRTDAGAWGAGTDTRIPWMGIRVSGIDAGSPNLSGAYAFVG